MQLLSGEKDLKLDDSAFWNGSYLLEGAVDQNGYSREFQFPSDKRDWIQINQLIPEKYSRWLWNIIGRTPVVANARQSIIGFHPAQTSPQTKCNTAKLNKDKPPLPKGFATLNRQTKQK